MPSRLRTVGPDISLRVAENIRKERLRRDWSVPQLSVRMHEAGYQLSEAVIRLIENGVYETGKYRPRYVTVDEAEAFAQTFGIPVSHLYRKDTRDEGSPQAQAPQA